MSRLSSTAKWRLAVGAGAVVVLALAGAATPTGLADALSPVPSRTSGADALSPAPSRVSEADGRVPDGVTLSPFDTEAPAVRNLDPALLAAVRSAAGDARAQGIEMHVTSGWRSKAYQQQLLDKAVGTYGSLEQARRFVNTPEKSAHVAGKAVDLGPTNADYWLIQHGAKYGLCQVYGNEIWHFELRTTPGGTCPALLPDAAG
ncbi:M15 family metallopeptidase [Kitasatospora sp. NPDC089509]|uniref:M15 family metallopeptidase n=1 Tax=Kitasatospora sp. NPDC089509 TaxID=3364079 RepID=UPI00382EDDB6